MKPFYEPSDETLQILNEKTWICSFSGGKDSTCLVSWIEWLRRAGHVSSKVVPRLVLSDTEVEYPALQDTTERMMTLLTDSGWECTKVTPLLKKKLYNSIFGRGLTPIHPAIRNMRWCTQGTKLDPMKLFARTISEDVLMLSGVRWGESGIRDEKLGRGGCSAGEECGLPQPDSGDRNVWGPIITWKTCQVMDWLGGAFPRIIRDVMKDILIISHDLMKAYDFKVGPEGFGLAPRKVYAGRFGCIGCPAIGVKTSVHKLALKEPEVWNPIRKVYWLWDQLRDPRNRVIKVKRSKATKQMKRIVGPIKMKVRKEYFPTLLEVQEKSGMTLVDEEDIAFIYKCWKDRVYPKGWSWEDDPDSYTTE